ncbi:MAG: flagellar basal body rod protein FlgB [Aquificaceae bacterium]|nr:flagellar basal body rod protein FlgB [Aquificaceae bacterium]MCS7196056.1 flagellar basal body rod protein FlgB [Aquificaceae bacterium]MCX7989111.1 flagellar basal body rod protein FlgB [Aquificaceae bacterium]MDW8032286.1 flagellar basal body rod protein FlgB [Aquificaceae bacterium]MDW8294442.1 flagellar basal body rod protein FlgB [Aquificaceae bacterium]
MELFKGVDKVMPYLNYAWKRHKVILSNLANADTPNYRTKEVAFSLEEGGQLKTTRPEHLKPVSSESFRVFEVRKRLLGNDLNDVSLEEEMAKLNQNRIAYEVYMRFATGSLQKLNNVIREGRQ